MSDDMWARYRYWIADPDGARIVEEAALHVMIYYTNDGYPAMCLGVSDDKDDHLEGMKMMMRWNQAVKDQILKAQQP